MSSRTSSRSTLTTVPSTMSPSLKYLMVSSTAARKASSEPMSFTATWGVEVAWVLLVVMCGWTFGCGQGQVWTRSAARARHGGCGARPSVPARLGTAAPWLESAAPLPDHGGPQEITTQRSAYESPVRRSIAAPLPPARPGPGRRGPAPSVRRVRPAPAGPHGHHQRHAQLERAAHRRTHQVGHRGELAGGDLEEQLVVDLEQHPRPQALGAYAAVHREHRNLDDVRG